MAIISEPENARSRRTREALLAAARAILEEEGFDALAMGRVAERAGVTRRSVYLHFASPADLVDALFDYVADVEDLDGSVARVWAAGDAVAALRAWAVHLAEYHLRVLAVDRAVDRVRRRDSAAAAHHRRVLAAKRGNCRRIVTWLHDEGRLAEPWTVPSATDMMNVLASSDVVEGLLVDRRWSRRRFAEHLAVLLESTFVGDG
ncbi:MAG: TetR/AcrR family transcriptional regulator [Streptosporangiales bacterium]|nr:TetR/AcrR family transcriptional regulator [Streptosporangiales bacterium]MBO0892327.1 TetR/AcrR family transcriptional regulator [Acidothermales bacterium]